MYWLLDTASFNVLGLFTTTLEAKEGSLFHFRNNIRATNDNTLEGYQFVNRIGSNFPNSVNVSHVERPDLEDNIIGFVIFFLLLNSRTSIAHSVVEEVLVKLRCNQIENWDDI